MSNFYSYTIDKHGSLVRDDNDSLKLVPLEVRTITIYSEDAYGHTVVREIEFPRLGQGPAVPASDQDLIRDGNYTNPNLHRRVVPQFPIRRDVNGKVIIGDRLEVAPRRYYLVIGGLNSFRTTYKVFHLDYQDFQDIETLSETLGMDIDESLYQDFLDVFEEMERREIP